MCDNPSSRQFPVDRVILACQKALDRILELRKKQEDITYEKYRFSYTFLWWGKFERTREEALKCSIAKSLYDVDLYWGWEQSLKAILNLAKANSSDQMITLTADDFQKIRKYYD